MLRIAVSFLLLAFAACATAPPPEPAPCPVEPVAPCDAITSEQRAVLVAAAEVTSVPLAEQPEALRALVGQHAEARANVARLRTELEACQRSNLELQERVARLEADIAELERLTIEMEMKAK